MINYSPDMVKKIRTMAGLTQTQAGALIGVSHPSVSMYENHGLHLSRARARDLVRAMAPLALAEVEERRICPLCGK